MNALVGLRHVRDRNLQLLQPKGLRRHQSAGETTRCATRVVISNPLGEDTSIMRTTALPSMMDVVARNCNARAAECARV